MDAVERLARRKIALCRANAKDGGSIKTNIPFVRDVSDNVGGTFAGCDSAGFDVVAAAHGEVSFV